MSRRFTIKVRWDPRLGNTFFEPPGMGRYVSTATDKQDGTTVTFVELTETQARSKAEKWCDGRYEYEYNPGAYG